MERAEKGISCDVGVALLLWFREDPEERDVGEYWSFGTGDVEG